MFVDGETVPDGSKVLVPIRSMTGSAQAAGSTPDGRARWTWDLKTLNAKGLDVRLRVPSGFDRLEVDARRRIGTKLTRGTCQASLAVVREAPPIAMRVDGARLAALAEALAAVQLPPSIGPATLDGLLNVRGIVESVETVPDAGEQAMLETACERGLDEALDALLVMREREGASLRAILDDRIASIEALTRTADDAPQRRPDAVRAKLDEAVAALAGRYALDSDRLYQEALILAAKADVREELDRLIAHAAAVRELIAGGGPVGRRLDFLAQELGREASTFCAKVNDAALTAIGLELRVGIEQFREQVQNVE